MTAPTFLACRQTFAGLADLAEHLLLREDISFVLLGKLTSDPLEGRFGWYRQLAGGNFFISVRQLMEGEKKIRILQEMQFRVLEEAVDLNTRTTFGLASSTATSNDHGEYVSENISRLTNLLVPVHDWNFTDSDTIGIVYYVSGCVGRSVSRTYRCSSCMAALVKDKLVDIDDICDFRDERGRLLQLADRGGLAEPTHLCLSICIIAYTYYKQIENNSDTWTIFIKMRTLQDVFVGAVQQVIAGEQSTSVLLTAKCDNGHVFIGTLLRKMFNCFVKNALKRMNECTTTTSKEATFRKVRKLQSEK